METTLAIENVGTWFNPHSRELDRAGLQRRWVRDHDVEVEQREHAEDGLLYAILKDGDSTREEPVDLFPFADVQVGPNCEFGRRITAVAVAVEYSPAAVTVSLIVPFTEIVTATRAYTESEADWLL